MSGNAPALQLFNLATDRLERTFVSLAMAVGQVCVYAAYTAVTQTYEGCQKEKRVTRRSL